MLKQNIKSYDSQEKRLALEVLNIRFTASNQGIDIKGIIPVGIPATSSSADVTTIAQT